ncbi:MAG: hypothetical protein J1E57_03580 [Prevotella sp.]|nr:hypothetical protein [Prevotella sp.]
MKFKILSILFALVAVASCVDDDLVPCVSETPVDSDIPEGIRSGYSLNMTVTLDKMGGTRAAHNSTIDLLLEEKENYIDPEKFRVLFFNSKDTFLFESKSRWVKKLNPNSDHSEWLVSVPVFTYGNDTYINEETGEPMEYDWKTIRKTLESEPFKVAILVNRPELDWYPGFKDLDTIKVPKQWYDNRGPYWDPNHTGKKDIFDLHHCQWDPMYHGKSMYHGFYDFIMDNWGDNWEDKYADIKPTLSATSSWVDWNKEGKDKHGWKINLFIHPSHEHPIPMYGVQEFDKIEKWTKGTPFNLSKITHEQDDENYNHKQVSLLRSVVRLELLIPKSAYKINKGPKFVFMSYPNIYARCEPMDVWTPTNELWEGDPVNPNHDARCELDAIMNYGTISKATLANSENDSDSLTTSVELYQERLSWFYGAWKEKNWPFKGKVFDMNKFAMETPTTPYPRIFNPCIQRNARVSCEGEVDMSDDDPDYYHYVVYTGERNLNDPSKLYNIKRTSNGEGTVISWVFDIDGKVYSLPITNYENKNNPALFLQNVVADSYSYATGESKYPTMQTSDQAPNGMNAYENIIQGYRVANNTMPAPSPETLPWPLIRNHVYQLILSNTSEAPLQTLDLDLTNFDPGTIKAIESDSWWKVMRTEKRPSGGTFDHWYNSAIDNDNKWSKNDDYKELMAGKNHDMVIPETKGLFFSYTGTGSGGEKTINIENTPGENSYYLRLNTGVSITFPRLKKGQIITIKGLTPLSAGANNGNLITGRYIKPATGSSSLVEFLPQGDYVLESGHVYGTSSGEIKGYGQVARNDIYVFRWKVKSDAANVTFTVSGSGLAFTGFKVEQGDAVATRAADNGSGFKVKSKDLYSKSIKFD